LVDDELVEECARILGFVGRGGHRESWADSTLGIASANAIGVDVNVPARMQRTILPNPLLAKTDIYNVFVTLVARA
jgi:hypothetical protein